jgi:hypothetical protein
VLRVVTSTGEACTTPEQLAERCVELLDLKISERKSGDGQLIDGDCIWLMLMLCTCGVAPGEQIIYLYLQFWNVTATIIISVVPQN